MFISFEGIDGSGKSTIAKMVDEKLRNEGYDTVLTREPGGVKIAEDIRAIILDRNNTNLDDHTEALLFAAARRQHLKERILPALKENKIVLCDRFVDSSLAYQGGGKHLGVDEVYNINIFATDNLLPDLTLLFDMDPKEALKRIDKNKNREVNRLDLEKMSFYDTVRNTFLDLAKKYPSRIKVIDASKSIDEVLNDSMKIIEEKLHESKWKVKKISTKCL